MARALEAKAAPRGLVALKAVPPGYPLRGNLSASKQARIAGREDARYSRAR